MIPGDTFTVCRQGFLSESDSANDLAHLPSVMEELRPVLCPMVGLELRLEDFESFSKRHRITEPFDLWPAGRHVDD